MTEPYEPPAAATPPPAAATPPPAPNADDWRDRNRMKRVADTGTVVWGLILLAVGGWFFLDHTLELDMPRIDWSDFWPVILIVIGAVVILQGFGRRSS
jgi:hypothetical protein